MSDDLEALRARAVQAKALAALGKRLLFAEGVRPSPREGIAHLDEAAKQGDGEATALIARLAAWGVLQPRDISRALDLLQRAAELGWGPAQTELRFLARADGCDWPTLRASIDVEAWLKPSEKCALMERPRIRAFEAFATPAECEWLIDRVRGGLQRAQVYSGSSQPQTSSDRTNSEAGLLIKSSDIVVCLIRDRIAAAMGVAPDFCEVTKILHYQPGQTFARHADFLDTAIPSLREEIEHRGQRVATFLLYLNDDFVGGETDFPDARFRYKGRRGDGLLFLNVDAAGAPDYSSVHAGLPPISGEKWILSQWIRSRPVNAFMTPGPSLAPIGPDWLQSI